MKSTARTLGAYACILLSWLVAGCAQTPTSATTYNAAQATGDNYVPLILVSIDGFRPDYLGRGVTPNLNALAAHGVRAAAMHPSFPSVTFPNHYTLVTGLRPDHHGIVGNKMEDPALPGLHFSVGSAEAVTDHRWWDQAEPVWVTAEKNRVRSAIMFWPGSEAAIHGVLPGEYRRFDDNVTPDARVDTVLGWLDKPAASRPGMLAIYFSDVDHAGHHFGPDSAEIATSAARVDAAIGRLSDGLRARHIKANLVIVSDHGMAAISAARSISLNQIAPPASYRAVTSGTYAGIDAQAGQEAALAAALLKPHEHMQCWKKEDIPPRLHYGQNARVPRFVCLADVGWIILPGSKDDKPPHGGAHGYDNLAPEMQALFIATGPAFKSGVVLPPFDNVDVYPLLMKLISLPALPSDGSLAPLEAGLTIR
jgi:ectonucleotide pyrophosphatase/phosphodiesterase family protein 5